MSSELSPLGGEFSCVSCGLVRAMALARMAASSASRSSVASVSAGGAKAISSCMGSEPPEAVCSVFAVRGGGIQVKTIGCRNQAKTKEAERTRCVDDTSIKITTRIVGLARVLPPVRLGGYEQFSRESLELNGRWYDELLVRDGRLAFRYSSSGFP